MAEETIVAVYDTAAHAAAAVSDLEAAHVPSGAISQHSSSTAGSATATTAVGTAQPAREPGFWSSLFGGESTDTAIYDRSMESGSTVVTVKVPDQHVDGVVEILERHNPIDIDERAASYGVSTGVAAADTTTTTRATTGMATTGMATTGVDQTRATSVAGAGDQVIQLAEEQINIGKRLVNRGTTKIRRFVVETPVEESVTLHSERVSVERRPASGDARVADAAFKDQVIEVTESAEEAVVGKTTRVKEEVVVRKDAADRVETVKDTVRREDVEITKDAGVTTSGTTATTGPATSGTTRPGV